MNREDYLEEFSLHIAEKLIANPDWLQVVIREGRRGLDGMTDVELAEAAGVWEFQGSLDNAPSQDDSGL
jgi:hypothetical protein